MKKPSWLWLCSLLLLLGLIGFGAWSIHNRFSAASAQASASSLTTAQTPEQLASLFYSAVEAQHYALAYTYLDPKATNANGTVFTQRSFIQLAKQEDMTSGSVTDFSATWYSPTLGITGMRQNIGSYHAHLQLRQEGQEWKIISLDLI